MNFNPAFVHILVKIQIKLSPMKTCRVLAFIWNIQLRSCKDIYQIIDNSNCRRKVAYSYLKKKKNWKRIKKKKKVNEPCKRIGVFTGF